MTETHVTPVTAEVDDGVYTGLLLPPLMNMIGRTEKLAVWS